MPVPKRDPHSGALIFHREPHEIAADENREQMQELRADINELKALVLSLASTKEGDQ